MTVDSANARRLQARALAREHGHYAYNIDDCPECSAKLEEWDAQRAVEASKPPPMPNAATDSAPAGSDAVAVIAGPTTPEDLLVALDAEPDDTAHARLLAAASPELRSEFHAMLIYRKLNADVEAAVAAQDAALVEFSWQLDAAVNDDERRALIAATDRGQLAEWKWRQNATVEDWQRRYLAMANGGGESDY